MNNLRKYFTKKIVISVLLIFLCITLFFFTWKAIANKNPGIVSPVNFGINANTPTIQAIPTILPEKEMGILLLGYGGAGHDGGFLTDAIQLLYLNNEKKTLALISIPRDLLVRSPAEDSKINAVTVQNATEKNNLIKSGMPALKQAVAGATGLPVNYFLAVDFVGIQRLIGEVFGTLEVEVHEILDDPWYPIKGNELETCGLTPDEIAKYSSELTGFELEKKFPCRYEHIHFDPGLTNMQGEEVLKYARSRHGSAEGDVSRGKRQQEVITSAVKKIFSLKSDADLPEFFSKLSTYLQSDIDKDTVTAFLPVITKAKEYTQTTVNLSPANVLQSSSSPGNGYVMIPKTGSFNWQSVHEYLSKEMDKN